jgi:hypothetical protein
MKQTEELPVNARSWDSIKIGIDYGYFAGFPSASITCYSDGMLEFKTDQKVLAIHNILEVVDREHDISKKSLAKLDLIINRLMALEKLEIIGDMCDGPSFECLIYLSNGTIRGFHYCSLEPSEEIQELENSVRKILREEFFLRKHKKKA